MASINIDVNIERKKNGIKIENLKKYFQSLENRVLTVGVHSDKGQDIVTRAKHTEFGTTKYPKGWETPFGHVQVVPPRPAIRMYLYEDMKDEISNEYQIAINRQKRTKLTTPDVSADKTLSNLGQECVYMQRDKMARGGYDQSTNKTGLDPEHNGDRTIAYKGFDDPWMQIGETISAVDYKVERRG